MSENELPSIEEAFRSLCTNGDQFASTPLAPLPLEGQWYEHHRRGLTNAAADDRVLAATGPIYSASYPLRQALQKRGANALTLTRLMHIIRDRLEGERKGMLWGVSGYTGIGPGYGTEANAMIRFYTYLTENANRRPRLMSDGGSSAGVLGLNGILARHYGVPTLGFTPLQGIASMAPRDHMAIHGQLYRDREALVGIFPDIIACFGGGSGTLRECQVNLRHGGRALLMALKNDGPQSFAGSWQTVPDFASAEQQRRLVVCHSLNDIPASIDKVLAASDPKVVPLNRTIRLRAMARILSH